MSKARRRQVLRRQARALARRQRTAVALNLAGPLLGRVQPAYELAERTRAVTHGGIGLLARLVDPTRAAARPRPLS